MNAVLPRKQKIMEQKKTGEKSQEKKNKPAHKKEKIPMQSKNCNQQKAEGVLTAALLGVGWGWT